MRFLPAQPVAYQDMNRQLIYLVRELVYDPIATLAKEAGIPAPLLNAVGDLDALVYALRVGKISYADGKFSGAFRSETSRALRAMGAKFSAARGTYGLSDTSIPGVVRAAAVVHRQQAQQLHDAMLAKLDAVQAGLDAALDHRKVDATLTVNETNEGMLRSAEELRTMPTLTQDGLHALAKKYERTIDKPIRGWAQAEVVRLRRAVQKSAARGARFDVLVEGIRREYGETRNHARFIAQQETSMFQAAFRQERFGEAGVTTYMWRTAHDERVRESHRLLNGRILFYSTPPIVDLRTGRRANPGVDYGCRCADLPALANMAKK